MLPTLLNRFFIFVFVSLFYTTAYTQDSTQLYVISSFKDYQELLKENPDNELTELKSLSTNLVYDIRYATTYNFMNRLMYPAETDVVFLLKPYAMALQKVQEQLNKEGLGLKIFDGYRPYSVSVKFWELIQDERYVANPARGSGHNRGIAVDVTLIHLSTGEELDMGTGYDNFTDTAHSTFTALPENVLQNRRILTEAMAKEGFKVLSTEWWHFYIPNANHYPVLNIPFTALEN